MTYNENERIFFKFFGEMACGFSAKCRHYNAWWCDTNHNSCTVKKQEEKKSVSGESGNTANDNAEKVLSPASKSLASKRKKGGA